MRPEGSAPHFAVVELATLSPLPTMRAARAAALDRYLDEGGASYSEIATDLLGTDGWTPELLDAALEDLARNGRVNIRGDLGWVEVEPLEMEDAA